MSPNGFRTDSMRSPLASIEVEVEVDLRYGNLACVSHASLVPTNRPNSSYDLSGWTEITCWQAEIVRRLDLQPASSYTDVDKPDVFTEWWTAPDPRTVREVPVLREYRDRDGCRHYLANKPSECATEEGDE